ncbi:MAG: putative quinone oxidoreductase, NADPH-dependent [Burkholderiales bacterium]|jgi:NADPH2:quinone reductase|nr:putative quinone oxidoreductase, NADPH-dependent [Burkholderiales bacterium]
MKAIEMRKPGGPEVLELTERPLPEPAAGEARVRAQTIGISSADMLVRKGVYNWMPPLPAIPGNEMAGVVDALGQNVSDVSVGQRVLVSSRELPFRGGCYAQAICVPASALFRLPDSIAPNDAASLPNFQLAGALLYESVVRKPRSIVAYGASGGVGMALLQLAKCDGIAAIGIVSTDEKRVFVQRAGIEHVLIRGKDDLRERVMALTGGRGVDVVYAMGGSSAAFIGNLDLLAPLGTVVSFSILGGLMPDADLYGELRKRLGKSLGVRVYSVHTLDHERELRRALMERAIELMAAGRLRPPPPTVLSLAEAARAHEMMEAGRSLGKIVLTP